RVSVPEPSDKESSRPTQGPGRPAKRSSSVSSQGSEETMTSSDRRWRRVRVERGIYLQPNGLYSVCVTIDGKPRFRVVEVRTVGEARRQRELLRRARLVKNSCRPLRNSPSPRSRGDGSA